MLKIINLLLLALCYLTAFGQVPHPLLGDLKFRNIGPANQGGRVVDIEADAQHPEVVYVATGSGGVFKSVNAGTTWMPIFDDYETASIGDIALNPNNSEVIWVGTGEANNRNSVSWGNGIYKSEDGVKPSSIKDYKIHIRLLECWYIPKNLKKFAFVQLGICGATQVIVGFL